MFRKSKFDPTTLVDTIVAINTSLNGQIKCDGNLRIEGMVEGTIECSGSVIVGAQSKVHADIRATNISVLGTVEGNIQGKRLEVLNGARIYGDVDVIDLLLDEGGLVRGQVIMRKDELPQADPLVLNQPPASE